MSTVRRVYFYAVSLVTLGIWAWGAGLILRLIFAMTFNRQPSIASSPGYLQQQLALGIAMVAIAGGVWVVHWRVVQRHAAVDPSEAGAALRKLYLSLILTSSALTALMTGKDVLRWLLGGVPAGEFSSGALAALIVSAGIWLYNWKVNANDGPSSPTGRTLQRWYWYFVSAWSLVLFSVALVNALGMVSDRGGLFGGQTLAQGPLWNGDMRLSLASFLLGVPWWWFHWFRAAGKDSESSLRQVYLYLFAITGGALAGLVALTVTLFRLLEYTLGGAAAPQADFFGFLGWTIPTMLIGIAVWVYHWQTVKDETAGEEERRTSARRVYYYMLSGLGLTAIASGIVFLVGLLVDLLLGTVDSSYVVISLPGWWRNQLALFIVLLLVGTVVWLYHWLRVQRDAGGSQRERAARSRKVYLYNFLCISIIGLVASLINIVYRFIAGFLPDSSLLDELSNMKWGLQGLLVSGPVLAYHLGVLREDMRAGAEKAVARKALVVVVDADETSRFIPRLEKELGSRVRAMSLEGEKHVPQLEVSDEQLQELARSVIASPQAKLLLLVHGTEVKLYPYQEK